MKIKFRAPDPRAGTIAQMDSSRGQHFIDTGAAVLVKEDGTGSQAVARAEVDKAIASLPGENTDPDYVVNAMRSHFKALFTDADEAKVRELVKSPQSGGQEVPQGEPTTETKVKKAAEPKSKGA